MRNLLIFIAILASMEALGQSPKFEFRGVWIASVANIDWPSNPNLSSEVQQKEFIDIVEYHRSIGLNVIIVQVRPCADALYHSTLEPWSYYFTGEIGRFPFPYYDPLDFMITEAHKRGIELHAWFNPYRAAINYQKNGVDSSSIAFSHPDWMLPYGDNLYFDPGNPECRQHTRNVVMDVVNRYAVDGVHFDDYFYPYRIANVEFPDSLSFVKFGGAFENRDDWRRSNVDQLIKEISDSIKAVKPHVQFGISPFGIWRNQSKDPRGSDTNGGQTCYDDLFADIVKWLENGWIDYVVPQLYWQIGHRAAPYEVLVDWWNQHAYGRPVYIGHGAYRVGNEKDSIWKEDRQILAQLELNKTYAHVKGSTFFSSRSLTNNLANLSSHLSSQYYKKPALLLPARNEGFEPRLEAEYRLRFTGRSDGLQIGWTDTIASHMPTPKFVLYRFNRGEDISSDNSDNIIAIIPNARPDASGYHFYVDRSARRGRRYTYLLTSVNAFRTESLPHTTFEVLYRRNSLRTYGPRKFVSPN